jgi:AsmA protein
MRWIKRLLVIGLGLVLAIALVLVAVVVLVNPNDYKDDIAKLVRHQTGLELHLAGDLKLAVFPAVAIDASQASLANPPGFGSEPFLAIDRMRLVVRLWPLLRKHFEVKRVQLDGLRLHLIIGQAGKGNWESIGRKQDDSDKTAKGAGTSSGPTARIAGLDIRDSTVTIEDLRDKSTRRFTHLNVKTGELGTGSPVAIEVSTSIDSGAGSKVTTLSFKTPALSADFDAQTLSVPEFALGYGELELSGSVTGRKLLGERELEGALNLKETSLRSTLEEFKGAPLNTRDPKAFARVGFDTKFALTPNAFQLTALKARLDETELTGSLGIADLDKTALVFDLKADQLNIDHYRAPEEKKAPAKAEKPAELPIAMLKALNARGTLKVGRAIFSGMTLDDVTLKLNAADGRVHVGPTQARLYGGSYRGDVNIDARGSDARFVLEQHVSAIDFAKLLADAFNSKRFSGRGVANAALTGHGLTADAITRTLAGNVDFNVTDGALEGHDLWFELRRARALIKRETAPEGEGSGRTRFDVLKGSGKFTDGTLSTDDLAMQTPFLKVAGQGTVAVPTQAVDLHINSTIYQVPPSGAGAEMSDLKTAVAIPVRVTGTISNYKVRPDLDAALKAEVKGRLEEKKNELKEKAKNKLKELLGG